jgi:iron complex outermembrane receptor protein
VIGTQSGSVPRERFLGEPGDGDIRIVNQTHQLSISHALSDGWTARAALAFKDASLRGFSTEAQAALQPDQRTLQRQRRYRDYASDDRSLQAELTGQVQTGTLGHELLLGVEAYRFNYDQRLLRINPSAAHPYAIDVLAPVYGQPLPAPLPNTDTREEQKNRAFYVQDALRLGADWRLLIGARFDRYDQSLHNRRTGLRTVQAPHASSPRLGLSWLATPQWTLFVNEGRSYRPNTGTDATGRAFAPERGRAAELGAKWDSADHGQGATLGPVRHPQAQCADQRSGPAGLLGGGGRGAQPWHGLRLHRRLEPLVARQCQPVLYRCRHCARQHAGHRRRPAQRAARERQPAADARAGPLVVGGGVTYSTKRPGEARTQAQALAGTARFDLPAYSVARLVAHWQLAPRLRLSLDVDNLFDRHYYASSYQRLDQPRHRAHHHARPANPYLKENSCNT